MGQAEEKEYLSLIGQCMGICRQYIANNCLMNIKETKFRMKSMLK